VTEASDLPSRLARIRSTVAVSADRAGRDPTGVSLVAVTKTQPVARVREGLAAGLRMFGENRVQEALPKIEELGTRDLEWHLIGHLQRNKVRFVEGHFRVLQSLDSLELFKALDQRLQSRIDVLIEVNLAEEPQKTGADTAVVEGIARAVVASQRMRLRGLMMIAPQSADTERARPVFRRLALLRDELAVRLDVPLPVLSMGMTDDYAVAVEEGSTMLRLGRALFGSR
jgi:PLP dependent protein